MTDLEAPSYDRCESLQYTNLLIESKLRPRWCCDKKSWIGVAANPSFANVREDDVSGAVLGGSILSSMSQPDLSEVIESLANIRDLEGYDGVRPGELGPYCGVATDELANACFRIIGSGPPTFKFSYRWRRSLVRMVSWVFCLAG